MSSFLRNHLSDLHGASLLAVDATAGVTGVVEAMQGDIARLPTALGGPLLGGAANGIAALVYASIRATTRLVGGSLDVLLGGAASLLGEVEPSPTRDALVSLVNGVVGDHLAATRNPLAIPTRLRRGGHPLELRRSGLARAIEQPSPKVAILVHGLCASDHAWLRRGHDHGVEIERRRGFTTVYLHYNSGRHVSTNGRDLAALLDALLDAWPVPVEDLAIVGHSMGGLVARSACHYAVAEGRRWPERLQSLVSLGTPHHGAPLERHGQSLHLFVEQGPFIGSLSRLGRLRSAGITDLRHGSLLDDDWQGRDRFAHRDDPRCPVPLPEGVRCHAIAATTGRFAGDLSDRLLGDGLVPLWSALGRHRDARFALDFAPANQWIAWEAGHLDLLDRRDVCARICDWL